MVGREEGADSYCTAAARSSESIRLADACSSTVSRPAPRRIALTRPKAGMPLTAATAVNSPVL